jgi:hypothetical protein
MRFEFVYRSEARCEINNIGKPASSQLALCLQRYQKRPGKRPESEISFFFRFFFLLVAPAQSNVRQWTGEPSIFCVQKSFFLRANWFFLRREKRKKSFDEWGRNWLGAVRFPHQRFWSRNLSTAQPSTARVDWRHHDATRFMIAADYPRDEIHFSLFEAFHVPFMADLVQFSPRWRAPSKGSAEKLLFFSLARAPARSLPHDRKNFFAMLRWMKVNEAFFVCLRGSSCCCRRRPEPPRRSHDKLLSYRFNLRSVTAARWVVCSRGRLTLSPFGSFLLFQLVDTSGVGEMISSGNFPFFFNFCNLEVHILAPLGQSSQVKCHLASPIKATSSMWNRKTFDDFRNPIFPLAQPKAFWIFFFLLSVVTCAGKISFRGSPKAPFGPDTTKSDEGERSWRAV